MTSGSNSFMSLTQSPVGGVECVCIPCTKRPPNAAGDEGEISCCPVAVPVRVPVPVPVPFVGVAVVPAAAVGLMAAVGNSVEPLAMLSLRLAAK